jgi:eukaryotic-like serine/threonine-protein kinase
VAESDLSGEVLDRRYRILERMSSGAMGVVYRGVRTKLDRPVAIKVMHGALVDGSKGKKRFEREAQLMARLDHPHCVSIIDYGIHLQKPYVVMELVRGQSLYDMLAELTRIEIPRAVEIMRQILSGLEHVHEQGIIHRDLKPANIMVTPKAPLGLHVRLLDFGLARMLGASNSLSNGIAVGTPSYMAPEQCRGDKVDVRCDIYACGIVLFEMLTGKKPLTSDDPLDTIKMQIDALPPRLADMAPGNYGKLEDVVERALAKAPDERYPSAIAMSEALEMALAGGSKATDTAVMRKSAASSDAPPKPIVRPTAPASRSPVMLVFLLLAAAAVAALYWYGKL